MSDAFRGTIGFGEITVTRTTPSITTKAAPTKT
jgi:hypothetical protein